MNRPDLLQTIWQVFLAYPAVAFLLLALVAMFCVVIVIAFQDLSRPAAGPPPAVDMDDTDDYNWIDTTSRMPLEPAAQQRSVAWGKPGRNWWPLQ